MNHTQNKGHEFACHSHKGFFDTLETKCWQSRCDVLKSQSHQPLSIADGAREKVEAQEEETSETSAVSLQPSTQEVMEEHTGVSGQWEMRGISISLCLRPLRFGLCCVHLKAITSISHDYLPGPRTSLPLI